MYNKNRKLLRVIVSICLILVILFTNKWGNQRRYEITSDSNVYSSNMLALDNPIKLHFTRIPFIDESLAEIIQDNVPYLIAEIDGSAINQDVDSDGDIEKVTSVGTVPISTIYEWNFIKKQFLTQI